MERKMTTEELVKTVPPDHKTTYEELLLCTDYSNLESWVYILAGERMSGRSRYRGPPGLLPRVEILLSSTTAPEMISMLLERTIPTEKITAGLAADDLVA